jgi:hypothetical protein
MPRQQTPPSDINTVQRAAIVTRLLVQGGTITPAEVARLTDCTRRNAFYLLENLSTVLAIRDEEGKWFMIK